MESTFTTNYRSFLPEAFVKIKLHRESQMILRKKNHLTTYSGIWRILDSNNNIKCLIFIFFIGRKKRYRKRLCVILWYRDGRTEEKTTVGLTPLRNTVWFCLEGRDGRIELESRWQNYNTSVGTEFSTKTEVSRPQKRRTTRADFRAIWFDKKKKRKHFEDELSALAERGAGRPDKNRGKSVVAHSKSQVAVYTGPTRHGYRQSVVLLYTRFRQSSPTTPGYSRHHHGVTMYTHTATLYNKARATLGRRRRRSNGTAADRGRVSRVCNARCVD